MTIEARWNLQHGVPENTNNPSTTYNPESALDRYVLARVKNRLILKEQDYTAIVEATAADIVKVVDKMLDDSFNH